MTIITLYATIKSILPRRTVAGGTEQDVLLANVTTTDKNVQVNPVIQMIVKLDTAVSIPFAVGDPITVRGTYDSSTNNAARLAVVRHVHAPTGFIRYKGRVYS